MGYIAAALNLTLSHGVAKMRFSTEQHAMAVEANKPSKMCHLRRSGAVGTWGRWYRGLAGSSLRQGLVGSLSLWTPRHLELIVDSLVIAGMRFLIRASAEAGYNQ